MFKQNQDNNQQQLLKKLEIIERTTVDKKEYQQISKTIKLKKLLNRDLKFHTSIWGSHNPSWSAGANNFLEKEINLLNNCSTSFSTPFSGLTWSDKIEKHCWDENKKIKFKM